MCKNLPILCLPNEGDDLILQIDDTNEHCNVVLKIKEEEKLCKYCSGSFNNVECHDGKENPYSHKGN